MKLSLPNSNFNCFTDISSSSNFNWVVLLFASSGVQCTAIVFNFISNRFLDLAWFHHSSFDLNAFVKFISEGGRNSVSVSNTKFFKWMNVLTSFAYSHSTSLSGLTEISILRTFSIKKVDTMQFSCMLKFIDFLSCACYIITLSTPSISMNWIKLKNIIKFSCFITFYFFDWAPIISMLFSTILLFCCSNAFSVFDWFISKLGYLLKIMNIFTRSSHRKTKILVIIVHCFINKHKWSYLTLSWSKLSDAYSMLRPVCNSLAKAWPLRHVQFLLSTLWFYWFELMITVCTYLPTMSIWKNVSLV